jgi:putative hydrolase of the HAD superfamily
LISQSTVVFDVGGTLLRFNYAALAKLYVQAAAAQGALIDFQKAYRTIEQLESEMPIWQQKRQVSLEKDNGREFWDSFYSEGFRRLGVTQDMSLAVTEIRERFQRAEFEQLFEDVIPTLEHLAARGVQLGILSNFSANLEEVLRQLDVHRYFRFFVVSGIAGVEKPDPEIFELTIRVANRQASDIVYIGDSIFHDIEGARQAGMAAILLDRQNRYPDFQGARIQSLRELIQ